jgi:hypothetical protein
LTPVALKNQPYDIEFIVADISTNITVLFLTYIDGKLVADIPITVNTTVFKSYNNHETLTSTEIVSQIQPVKFTVAVAQDAESYEVRASVSDTLGRSNLVKITFNATSQITPPPLLLQPTMDFSMKKKSIIRPVFPSSVPPQVNAPSKYYDIPSQTLTVTVEKESYNVGEDAVFIIESPFAPAHGNYPCITISQSKVSSLPNATLDL